MASALDSGSSGTIPSPVLGYCDLEQNRTLTVLLSTEVYRWIPANLTLRVTLLWTSIPSRGE